MSRDIFSKILSYIHVLWTAFLKEKGYFFWKIKMSRLTRGGGVSKIGQKSVTYYLNAPKLFNSVVGQEVLVKTIFNSRTFDFFSFRIF